MKEKRELSSKNFLRSSRFRVFYVPSKALTYLAVLSFFFLSSFATFNLFSPITPSNAESPNTNTASSSTPAGTISLSSSTDVPINITPTPTQTIYSSNTTLSITNSCKKGATITLSTNKPHNNLERQGQDTLTKTISSVSGGTLTDNTWGYKKSTETNFLAVPTKDTTPATIYSSTTNTPTTPPNTPDTLTLTYAVKTDDTLPSGTYSTDLLYTVSVKPECIHYTLKFNLDGGTGKPGQDHTDKQIGYGELVNLSTYKPEREDYAFDGWTATTNNPAVSPVSYTGNETNIDLNPTNDMEVTLKAKWKDAIGLMQDFDCSTLGLLETRKLRDKRDDNKYIVVKMTNMKCWMTQNLQIENKILTPEDSNVITNYTLPASSQNGFSAYDTSNVYIDPTYGGYYNWYTATAGAGLKDVTAPTYGSSDYNVASSICPRGWRLPTSGNDDSDFGRLPLYLAGFNPSSMVDAITSPPLKFTLSGQLYSSLLINQGEQGHYWSSTPAGFIKSKAYYLYFGGSTFEPKNILNDKNYGKSVRCIAEDRTIHSIKYMQEISPKICENTTTPYKTSTALDTDGSHHRDKNFVPTKTLIDRRDNNTYTVSKLADGKCWMTQNLRIVNKTITPADSDVMSNYTIPTSSISGFYNHDVASVYMDSTYGGYYSWPAATAGTGTTSLSTQYQNTTVSICSKGWRLPTSGNSTSDFQTLYNNYNSSSALRSAPMNLTLSGYAYSSSMYGQGSYGYYWSSTVYSSPSAYYLRLGSSGVLPSDYYTKFYGFSVRCVAR